MPANSIFVVLRQKIFNDDRHPNRSPAASQVFFKDSRIVSSGFDDGVGDSELAALLLFACSCFYNLFCSPTLKKKFFFKKKIGVYQFELSLGINVDIHRDTDNRRQRFTPRARLRPYSHVHNDDWLSEVLSVAILPGKWTHFGYSYDKNSDIYTIFLDGHDVASGVLCEEGQQCTFVVNDGFPIRIG